MKTLLIALAALLLSGNAAAYELTSIEQQDRADFIQKYAAEKAKEAGTKWDTCHFDYRFRTAGRSAVYAPREQTKLNIADADFYSCTYRTSERRIYKAIHTVRRVKTYTYSDYEIGYRDGYEDSENGYSSQY